MKARCGGRTPHHLSRGFLGQGGPPWAAAFPAPKSPPGGLQERIYTFNR